jgi:hypothetical protein
MRRLQALFVSIKSNGGHKTRRQCFRGALK